MITDQVVIQKIEPDQGVRLYQNFQLRSPWSFEPYRVCSPDDVHSEIFPFLFDSTEQFHVRWARPETQLSVRKNKDIWFADDYGLPAGMLVGILFPKHYAPEIFKFKEKPHIPIGGPPGSTSPPGYVDVYFNRVSHQGAITFLITKTTYFGFKCIAKYYEENFPHPRHYAFVEELIGTLGLEESPYIVVTRSDLENFKPVFNENADLDEVADLMTNVIRLCKEKSGTASAELQDARSKLTTVLDKVVGTAGSLTTILDSYNNSGIVNTIISKLLAFFAL